MQFKLASRSFRPWHNLGGALVAICACIVVGGALPRAEAATTFSKITSINGGATIDPYLSTRKAYYYASANGATAPDPGVNAFFLNSSLSTFSAKTLSDNNTGADTAFGFAITSGATTYTPNSGENAYLVAVQAIDAAGTLPSDGAFYASFTDSSGNENTGSGNLSSCITSTYNSGGSTRCAAINMTSAAGRESTFYLKPGSVCNGAATSASSPCLSATSIAVTNASTKTLYLKFLVISLPATTTFPLSKTDLEAKTVLESGTMTLSLHQTVPTVTCSSGDLSYFPGDTQIFADLASISSSWTSTATTRAPIYDGVAGFNVRSATTFGALPSLTTAAEAAAFSNFRTGLAISANSQITGTTNSTSATGSGAYFHNVAISLRDATGLIAPTSTCGIRDAVSAEVRGLLNNSKCFIATAAYASADVPPVKMLRKFRDQVLAPTEWGRAFIAWYYAWSPPAAEWLFERPIARAFVLVALIPVEIFAWFALHIGAALSIAVLSMSAMVGLYAWRSRRSWA